MGRIGVRRDTLANMLRSHGEDDLAERPLSPTDDELTRVGTLGAYYAWSEEALALGGSMGGARALSLATIGSNSLSFQAWSNHGCSGP